MRQQSFGKFHCKSLQIIATHIQSHSQNFGGGRSLGNQCFRLGLALTYGEQTMPRGLEKTPQKILSINLGKQLRCLNESSGGGGNDAIFFLVENFHWLYQNLPRNLVSQKMEEHVLGVCLIEILRRWGPEAASHPLHTETGIPR